MLTAAFAEGQSECMDDEIVRTIVTAVLDPPDGRAGTYSESLRIEILQFSTLLVKHCAELMTPHKKELMKFGWSHLKHDESVCQSYGYVFVSHILCMYPLPDKILLQVRGGAF